MATTTVTCWIAVHDKAQTAGTLFRGIHGKEKLRRSGERKRRNRQRSSAKKMKRSARRRKLSSGNKGRESCSWGASSCRMTLRKIGWEKSWRKWEKSVTELSAQIRRCKLSWTKKWPRELPNETKTKKKKTRIEKERKNLGLCQIERKSLCGVCQAER